MPTTRRTVLGAGLALPLPGRPAVARRANGVLRDGLSAHPPNLQPRVPTGVSAGTVKMPTRRSLVAWDGRGALRGRLPEFGP